MEKVLEFRENNEQAILEKYSLVQNDLNCHVARVEYLMNMYEDANRKSTQYKDIENIRQLYMYKQKIEQDMTQENNTINKINEKLEIIRLELVEAQKDRRVMEIIKEKDQIKYLNTIKQIEQKELDEIAILRYNPMVND
ncbi:MAG: flagellar export protein FliJ [Eubacteriaceae bacterium]